MGYERSPTLQQLFDGFRTAVFADLHVAFPAVVRAFDPVAQSVDVQPALQIPVPNEDGTGTLVSMAIIPKVPVVYLGGGGFKLVYPLVAGDTVLVVVAERSIDRWCSQGGVLDPQQQRSHHLADAVAIPGLRPFNTLQSVRTDAIVLGGDGGGKQVAVTGSQVHLGVTDAVQMATDALALASKVDANFTAFKGAYDGHTHVYSPGPSPPIPTAPPIPSAP